MSNKKKIYIGISAIIIIIIGVVASIFYIKEYNKNVEVAQFEKNLVNENTKEAMKSTEELDDTNEMSNENINSVQTENEEEKDVVENETKETEEVKEDVKEEVFTVTQLSKTLYVNATSLNVRTGPKTTYSRLGALTKASEVTVTGKVDSSTWYRISYNGKVGYVDGSYLSETKPIIEEPVVNNEDTTKAAVSGSVKNLIIINSRNNTLRYYINGNLIRSYSCATGASATPTPTGKFSVYNKIVNRPYYKAGIEGGAPNNPLGKRWIGLDCEGRKGDTYAIHGTNVESSIGKNVSHGCIRMHNADVESLFEIVPVGTTVIIKSSSETDKQIATGYGINIE